MKDPQKASPLKRRQFLSQTLACTTAMVAGAAVTGKAEDPSEKITKPTQNASGQFVVFASQTGAALDSNVHTGGGTDDTDILQAVLDKAPEWGSVYLIMDGAALIHGLKLHSNTTIECLNASCGFFQRAQTKGPMLQNANLKFRDGLTTENISILGGTYNNNALEQVHDFEVENLEELQSWYKFNTTRWNVTFEFAGIENLLIRDVTIQDQRTFAMTICNFYHAIFENILILRPNGQDYQNQDGIHVFGPGQFLTMRNITGDSGDDFIALAPDEIDDVSNLSDILIDGVHLIDADQGIRLLSRNTGRLDNVVIRNVSGTYRSFGFFIEPFFDNASTKGNYGNIIFDTIDLRPIEPVYDYRTPFLFSVRGSVESLICRNISNHNPSDNRVLFDIGANIKSFLIDGLRIFESNEASADAAYIQLHGQIHHMVVRDVEVIRQDNMPTAGTLIQVQEEADVKFLLVNDTVLTRMNTLLSVSAGQMSQVILNHVFCSNIGPDVISVDKGEIQDLACHCVIGAELISEASKAQVKSLKSI